jgi:hypothetical protein
VHLTEVEFDQRLGCATREVVVPNLKLTRHKAEYTTRQKSQKFFWFFFCKKRTA